LISLARIPNTENYRYVYWVGTSFSTPLVSEMVALIMERDGIGLSASTASTIESKIMESAYPPATVDQYLGSGIINLCTLHATPCPMPTPAP
jgi:subtilisin family serine protease